MYDTEADQSLDLELAINNAHAEWLRECIVVRGGILYKQNEDGTEEEVCGLVEYFLDPSAVLCDALDLPHLSIHDVTDFDYDTVPHGIDYEAEDYE